MADHVLPDDVCPSHATPAEHVYGWPQSATDPDTGAVIEVRNCMMCGKEQLRVHGPIDWGPWLDVK